MTQTEIEPTVTAPAEEEAHFRISEWIESDRRGTIKANFAVEIVSYGMIVEGFAYGLTTSGIEFILAPMRKCGDTKIPIVKFVSPEYARWNLDQILTAVRAFIS